MTQDVEQVLLSPIFPLPCVSVCTGIGGFELGMIHAQLHRLLYPSVFIEKDSFCQSILKKHFPSIPIINDFKSVTVQEIQSSYQEAVRSHRRTGKSRAIFGIYGGIPCQPYSNAGKKKATEDERDLFQDFYRVVGEIQKVQAEKECQPVFAIIENVPGLLSQSKEGRVVTESYFQEILKTFAQMGFLLEWHCTRASSPAIGGLHRRERLWILAYTPSHRWKNQWGKKLTQDYQEIKQRADIKVVDGLPQLSLPQADESSSESRFCDWTHGLSQRLLDATPKQAIEDTITSKDNIKERMDEATDAKDNESEPFRKDKLRVLGNAIVPQQAAQIWQLLDRRLQLTSWADELHSHLK